MKYNGLEDRLEIFAQFMLIYAEYVKLCTKKGDFENRFPAACDLFNKRISPLISKSNIAEMEEEPFVHTKLLFTVTDYKIKSFCRHLRNSFAHANLSSNGVRYLIKDYDNGKLNTIGELDILLVDDFLDNIIKDYEK